MRGFIAFLDVLGFSNLVDRPDYADLSEALMELASEEASDGEIGFAVASDSLIFSTQGESDAELLRLLGTVARICYGSLVDIGLPIRGGVAVGPYSEQDVKIGGKLLAGPAVVNAYKLEQAQDWIGVSLSPGISELLPELRNYHRWTLAVRNEPSRQTATRFQWAALLARYQSIPLKTRSTLDGLVVLPHQHEGISSKADFKQYLQQLRRFRNQLDVLKLAAPNEGSQAKYSATRDFLNGYLENVAQLTSRDSYKSHMPS